MSTTLNLGRGILVKFNHENRQTAAKNENLLSRFKEQRQQVLSDLLVAVLVVLVLWMTVPAPDLPLRIFQMSLGLVAIIGVGLRHFYPRSAFIFAFVSTVIAVALGLSVDPLLLAGIALNSVAARHGHRAFASWMLGLAIAGAFMALFLGVPGSENDIRNILFSGITLCVAWALGVKTRVAQQLTAANAAMAERIRLARDVHDVLSHSLGTIGVQAGVAAHIEGHSQEQLRDTLREIEQRSRSSIAELKTLLSTTRGIDGSVPSAATLADLLAATAQTARRAGVPSSISITGIEQLPVTHSVTTHRIVQEAVTNVLRHSGATHCDIRVTASDQAVNITVTDNGRGKSGWESDGFGLVGMHERVNLLGGTLSAGSLFSGGFEVSAVLPLAQPQNGEDE